MAMMVSLFFATMLALAFAPYLQGQTGSAPTLRPPAHGAFVDGQPPYSMPPATAQGVLLAMSDRADVIFAGTVLSVHRPPVNDAERNAAAGTVEITFSVEQPIRGTTAGATYTVREWAGLWRDSERFIPGQHRLMLLHAASPGGLSSPVDGLDGAIPIVAGVTAEALPSVQAESRAGAPVLPTSRVDPRWLEAKALRATTFSGPTLSAAPRERPSDDLEPAVAGVDRGLTPALSEMLDVLASWQEMRHAAR